MHRRRFLQLVGLAAAAAVFRLPFDLRPALGATRVVTVNGVMYRGDRRGRIYASTNTGATWELHTYLGPGYSIKRMATDGSGRLRATIGFRRRSFGLRLAPDAKRWLTA